MNDTTTRMSCRACTVVCRFSLKAILAHQGISYSSAEATIEMPDVPYPELTIDCYRPNRVNEPWIHTDPKNTVTVPVGKPIALGVDCKKFFSDGTYRSDHHPLGEIMKRVGPELMGAMRDALESVNWVYDSSDDLYSNACRRLGCFEG